MNSSHSHTYFSKRIEREKKTYKNNIYKIVCDCIRTTKKVDPNKRESEKIEIKIFTGIFDGIRYAYLHYNFLERRFIAIFGCKSSYINRIALKFLKLVESKSKMEMHMNTILNFRHLFLSIHILCYFSSGRFLFNFFFSYFHKEFWDNSR